MFDQEGITRCGIQRIKIIDFVWSEPFHVTVISRLEQPTSWREWREVAHVTITARSAEETLWQTPGHLLAAQSWGWNCQVARSWSRIFLNVFLPSVCFLGCLIQWPVWNESSAEAALGPSGKRKWLSGENKQRTKPSYVVCSDKRTWALTAVVYAYWDGRGQVSFTSSASTRLLAEVLLWANQLPLQALFSIHLAHGQ